MKKASLTQYNMRFSHLVRPEIYSMEVKSGPEVSASGSADGTGFAVVQLSWGHESHIDEGCLVTLMPLSVCFRVFRAIKP